MDDTWVWAELQVEQVEWSTGPQVNTGKPDQDGLLETLGQVWAVSVPCQVPVPERIQTTESAQTLHQSSPEAQKALHLFNVVPR